MSVIKFQDLYWKSLNVSNKQCSFMYGKLNTVQNVSIFLMYTDWVKSGNTAKMYSQTFDQIQIHKFA